MPKRFFKLADDVYVPRRWHLDTPLNGQGIKLDDAQFRSGAPLDIQERLRIPVEIAGQPLDFTEAGLSIPVVHGRVASLFATRAPDDVQLLPVDVDGQPDQYRILVATRLIRCIDERASRIRFWTEEDGFPDMVGKYASVRDMRIDKSKVGTVQVFRCEGWRGPLIVSGDIKSELEGIGATGIRFTEV